MNSYYVTMDPGDILVAMNDILFISIYLWIYIYIYSGYTGNYTYMAPFIYGSIHNIWSHSLVYITISIHLYIVIYTWIYSNYMQL